MNKKLQVFVSSTYTDLIEERQATVEAILDAGHIPVGMELFKAGNESQLRTIYKWIDESDVYILIIGGKYGSIEEKSGLSYIELGYNYTLSKNMPVFSIVFKDRFLFEKADLYCQHGVFEPENIYKYNSFRNTVESNIVKYVSNIDQIYSIIHTQLNIILNDPDYNLIGWSKNIQNNNMVSSISIGATHVIDKDSKISTIKHNKISIFLVMPFSEAWSDETYDIIKEVCHNLDINLNRADEILGSQSIYNDIITNIIESDIIIADITIKNANVFYELGYAHALDKKVILIRQPYDNVPFDIAQFRYIEYELSFKKAKKFQERLTDTITTYKKQIYE